MKKMSGFAEALDANARMSHKSAPETGGTPHHLHVERKGDKVAVESHGAEHQVMAMREFGKGEHEKLGKHLMGHLGLDDKEPPAEADKIGEAYEPDHEAEGSAAGAAY